MAIVGGGFKKILYTLSTVKKVGFARAGKVLKSKNTCKACALGMGGQHGGMTNEAGEFPAVCNKSIQAQSSDMQPAIPAEVFDHPLSDFDELSARELEHLGRLNTPLHKAPDSDRLVPVSWDHAMAVCGQRLNATSPERSFFYASGRSSNEAGFVFQLLARCFGTNHVSNCSFYCHQATGVGLRRTIGTGTATIELADIDQADMIFVIGANPASNHPRFIHRLKACRDRGGEVIVINPARENGLVKFAVPKSPRSLLAGGSEIASQYLQPNIGSDIAVMNGIAKAVLEAGDQDAAYMARYCVGGTALCEHLQQLPWSDIVAETGLKERQIRDIAQRYGRARRVIFAWGMGITHHLHGVRNVEAISNLALLRGMVGRRGAGLLPLRGHSNVQGVGTIGVKPVLAEDVLERMQTHFGLAFPKEKGYDTMSAMQAAARGEMDVAVLLGGNLLSANPDTRWATDALNQIGTRVALTTTLNRSHVTADDGGELIVLPVAARDEEWEPTTQESMFNFVRLSDGQIERHPGVRPEVVVLADLATAILESVPIDFQVFKKHRRIRQSIAKIVPGMEALADIDVAKREFHIAQRVLHEPHFKTPDGKAHFHVVTSPAPLRSTREFALTTIRSEGQFNSIVYEEEDSYRGVTSRWSVLMSPADGRTLGVEAGDKVTLTSDVGQMRDVIVGFYDLPAGNLMAYYPEANVLTSTQVDPQSLTPSFKHTRVSVGV
ncbi:MAG: FdhF/YdeP family oxidoreductase [Gammaproteobacteria bacterium]